MAGGVGVLRPEGGAECVNVAEGEREDLACELSAHREVGGLAKKVATEVDRAVLSPRQVGQVERGDTEHLAGALAVGSGDDGRVHVDEPSLAKKLMDSERERVA